MDGVCVGAGVLVERAGDAWRTRRRRGVRTSKSLLLRLELLLGYDGVHSGHVGFDFPGEDPGDKATGARGTTLRTP
jgi:hypothetical protein